MFPIKYIETIWYSTMTGSALLTMSSSPTTIRSYPRGKIHGA